ncbi:RICIN domain-containing protein [Actinoallomurus soli]|uniref:RICIN domain-containing protein n=1 Tax=Actinoallomurus soli TaxID=2952535 RepID=UPI0020927914|nr:RICIN domain-containing protein [Actinoallomurus soli]MCO5969097.1 RICIN domain-containing protein [Actinoallomurus soli]
MDDQNTPERQRRQRADLVKAFSRRAWQPSERPNAVPRILAGGVALIAVAGGAFAIGAVTSHHSKTAAEQRTRMAAMTGPGATQSPVVTQVPTLTPTPLPTPAAHKPPTAEQPGSAPVGTTAARHKSSRGRVSAAGRSSRSGLPQGPRFSSVAHVLIHNVMTGMCADLPGSGYGSLNGSVNQFPCVEPDVDNQRWDLVVGQKGLGPNGADLFTIRNSKDGLCMDLPGEGSVSVAGVVEYYCKPGGVDNQMWYLDKKAPGKFWIRSFSSPGHRCLDVSGLHGSGGPNANLTIYPCSLQDDHLWTFMR